jgi:hypothetical protein
VTRGAAEETLRALGVPLSEGHGSVEELAAKIRAATARTEEQRKRVVFSAESQCLRKRRHASPEIAAKVARRARNPDTRPYFCGHCGGYHNGRPAV